MHPDLQQALDDIMISVAGMTAKQLDSHPPGKWSTGLILEHLLLSYQASGARLSAATEEGTTKTLPDTLKQRFGAFVVVGLGHFPTGRTAPEYVQPKGVSTHDIVEATRTALVEFDATATRCARRFGLDTKVSNHPILGAFSVRQWRRFHRIHTRHHMKQVAGLRAQK